MFRDPTSPTDIVLMATLDVNMNLSFLEETLSSRGFWLCLRWFLAFPLDCVLLKDRLRDRQQLPCSLLYPYRLSLLD